MDITIIEFLLQIKTNYSKINKNNIKKFKNNIKKSKKNIKLKKNNIKLKKNTSDSSSPLLLFDNSNLIPLLNAILVFSRLFSLIKV